MNTAHQKMNYRFFKAPSEIFEKDELCCLSNDAKLLYLAMLNRLSLSLQNNWHDQYGNPYIIMTCEEAKKILGCANAKIAAVFAELEGKNGIRLISRKRQAVGKPNLIYVYTECWSKTEQKDEGVERCEGFGKTKEVTKDEKIGTNRAKGKAKAPKTKILQNKALKTKPNEVSKAEINISPDLKSEASEVRFSKTNNNNINKNNLNNNYINQSYHSYMPYDEWTRDRTDCIDTVKESVSYVDLAEFCDREILDTIITTMVNALCSDKDYLCIGGDNIPIQEVKRRMWSLRFKHIEFVYNNLISSRSEIRNISAYLLTAIYKSADNIGLAESLYA